MTLNCLFCCIAVGNQNSPNPEDSVFLRTPNFVVKPRRGQVVEGYTLVLSRQHYPAFACASVDELAELQHLSDQVADRLREMYQCPVIAFEHGDANPAVRTGGCIEHAHLHLVPAPVDLTDPLMSNWYGERLTGLRELATSGLESTSYIYYRGPDESHSLFRIATPLPGQYLRRLICARLGFPNEWDWALYPHRERILAFMQKLNAGVGDNR
jgi:diadenosine tetraphosphate (Ap4A) HIT family hydrolase